MASLPYHPVNQTMSDIQSEGYAENNFLQSLPDEHATVAQVIIWIASVDKLRYTSTDPDWQTLCNFDGQAINKFSLNELLHPLIRWGLETGSAEWLADRILFARGMRQGVKDYLSHELPKEIGPEFIIDMRTEVQRKIRREFDEQTMRAMKAEVTAQMINEIKDEMKEKVRADFEEEDILATIKGDIVEELRDQIRAAFDDDIMKQMQEDVTKQVKLEVKECLKFRFRGSIITGMKYEIMEDVKEDLAYDLNVTEETGSEYKPEPANTGRGRKRRK